MFVFECPNAMARKEEYEQIGKIDRKKGHTVVCRSSCSHLHHVMLQHPEFIVAIATANYKRKSVPVVGANKEQFLRQYCDC